MTVYTAPNRVTCIPGDASETGFVLAVFTLYDPVASPVTVTVNGQTYTSGTDFTMTARGTDGTPAQVCWSGKLTINGLSKFTRYQWSVSQTVSSTTHTDSGSAMTLPGEDDDFAFWFASCDNITGPNSPKRDATGAWKMMKEYDALPVVGLFYVDDYGYVDGCTFDDTYGSGLVSSVRPDSAYKPPFNTGDFAYTAAWCCMFGMLGRDDTDSRQLKEPREENRAWCRKNYNLYFQWGDHELENDIGWDDTRPVSNDPSPTSIHKTYVSGVGQFDGDGLKAFENMIGLTRPSLARSLDVNAQHWVKAMGCVTLVAPDYMTNCMGYTFTSAQKHSTTPLPSFQILGNNQIDDILSAVKATNPAFTVFGNAFSLKAPVDNYGSGLSEGGAGGQHFWYDYANAEWSRMFRDAGGFMNWSKTNGAYGCLLHLHGDYHNPHVYRISNANETMYEIGVGTVNGSAHFSYDGVKGGDKLGDIDVEYIASGDSDWSGSEAFHGLLVEVFGSRPAKELVVTLFKMDGSVAWKKRFVKNAGNEAYSGYPPFSAPMAVGEE